MSCRKLLSEKGYTMVEQMVALALFLSVLMPAGTFFIYMNSKLTAEKKIQARSFAQKEMELTLLNKRYKSREVQVGKRKWILRKEVRKAEAMVEIKIEVWESAKRANPLITLKTIRYVDKE